MGGGFAECRDGDGVLRMLPDWLCFLLRAFKQKKMRAARTNSAPTIAPITMPAMAPPDSPESELESPVAAPFVADGAVVELLVGNSGGIDTVVGSITPTHRDSTFELTQHELVELTVLSAQYEQSPCKLEP